MARFSTLLLFWLTATLARAESAEFPIHLAPDSPPLTQAGVPQLHESVDQALHAEDGLAFNPETPFQWAHLASTPAQHLSFTAAADSELYDHATLTVWNWHNRPVAQHQFAPGEPAIFKIAVHGLGTYQVTIDGCRNDQIVKRRVRSFAVTEDLNAARETWKTDEFFLGVCAFPGRYHWSFKGNPTLPSELTEDQARQLEATLLARLGFQVVRPDESLEMGFQNGSYQFDGKRMDAAVEAYTSRGLQLALQLMNAPDWAIANRYADVETNLWRYPREEAHQRHYVRELLRRYGTNARFIQIFNEPDQKAFWSGTPQEYVAQFQYTTDEIRNVDPEKPIVNGGYSLVDLDRTQTFVEALHDDVDMVAYHSHGSLLDLKEDVAIMKSLHRQAGLPMPRLVNTEMGYDGWRLDQERRKGQIVPQKTLYCWKSGHAGALLFGGRMTLGPRRTNQDFGFLDHHFCPRFVYGSVAALVSVLQGAPYHSTLQETDELFVYQFHRDEQRILAAFTLRESGSLHIQSDAESGELIDEMGNRTPIDDPQNFQLSLTGYPRYVILNNATSVTSNADH
tara:strand:- start:11007 stop:12704 length:1698 start_codon:yes stop_codon:yes gene_type:complete